MSAQPKTVSAIRGFTMIEVLIALLIVSLGMLGLAGLQAVSLKNGQSAYYRTVATQLAYDISDRMRGNVNGVLANSYNRTGINTDYATGVAACGTTAGCVSSDLAKNDAFEWQQLIQAALPGGEGIICIDSLPNDGTSGLDHGCDGAIPANPNERPLHAIKIWWLDDRSAANAAGTKSRFVFSFRL